MNKNNSSFHGVAENDPIYSYKNVMAFLNGENIAARLGVEKTIYHLVHLGYDSREQELLEKNIIKLIDEIAKDVNGIISFVDQYKPVKEDAEMSQINITLHLLVEFLKHGPKAIALPKKGFLEKLNFGKYKKISSIREFLDYFLSVLSEEKIEEFDNFKDIIEQTSLINNGNFEMDITNTDLLSKLLKITAQINEEFAGRNMFNNRYSKDFESIESNKKRRIDLEEYARDKLGEERLIQNWMNNVSLLQSEKNKNFFAQMEDKSIFNLIQYYENLNTRETKKVFLENGKMLGFDIMSPGVNHIIGGEYYNRCNLSYKELLILFGINPKNIQMYKPISLVNDIDKLY